MDIARSNNEIRSAIRHLSERVRQARREGRMDDVAQLERRIADYRTELGLRP
jgi:uncharacterized protein YlxW (UPF0749 family)